MSRIFLLVLVTVTALIGLAGWYVPSGTFFQSQPSEEGEVIEDVELLFVGDIMMSRYIGELISREGGSDFLFEYVRDVLSDADIVFGNFESPVSRRGVDQGGIYSFRTDPDALGGLARAGFDIVSLANNHIFDWGSEALVDSPKHLEEHGILSVGVGGTDLEAREPKVITRKGVSVAFLAYSQFAPKKSIPAVARLDEDLVIKDIQSIRTSNAADIIVVTVHWGDEYETQENVDQQRLARLFVDAGADIIIGHHPHVLQSVEEYNNGLIAYSLGNFIFDQNFSTDTRKSTILRVEVNKGGFKKYSLLPINFTQIFQPIPESTL